MVKYILFGVIGIVGLGIGGFFYLGIQSQGGTAPGLIDDQLSPCPSSPNCASSEASTDAEKRVVPLPADAWDQLPTLIAEMGGTVTVQELNYLAAEFTSATFKFVDDVEFRMSEDGVHIRSASRVGYSDRGVNKARIEDIRARLAN
jgi:uncharacterized protein (DUF1499 family)